MPDPDQCISEGLFEDTAVAVTGGAAEEVTVVVALGFERSCSALTGHDPVVMRFLGIFGANIVFRHVSEDAQRFLLTLFDQAHARVIFPRSKRKFGLIGSVIVLLVHKGPGVGDNTPEQIWPKPAHAQR